MQPDYRNKNVLIFGLGLNQGGVGSARFFVKKGANVKITDLKTADQLQTSLKQLDKFPDIKYILGEHRCEDFDWADLIIKNPSVKPNNEYLQYAQQKGKNIQMDMGIFLQFVHPQKIIGVTGTKGKSTTSSLIYEILKAANKDVVFAGNIGKSVLNTIDHVTESTLVVLELSSFQLEAFDQHQVSPKYAVITNISEDHLNYYPSFEDYIQAKRIIAKYQTSQDYLFIKQSDNIIDQDKFLNGIKSHIIRFYADQLPQDFQPKLPGQHNKENMAAALAVSKILGIEQNIALTALKHFNGVEFRLQLIKEFKGIKIYNDTTATNPEATIQALNTFPGCILIAGGMNKNMLYNQLSKLISNNPKAIFFLKGDATDTMISLIQDHKLVKGIYDNLEKLLTDVKAFAKSGDIILFSPGATSFNLFQNEFDRGRKFNQAVETVFTDPA